ncbi:Cytochrome P450 4V2, partial [Stylophora pistillata]
MNDYDSHGDSDNVEDDGNDTDGLSDDNDNDNINQPNLTIRRCVCSLLFLPQVIDERIRERSNKIAKEKEEKSGDENDFKRKKRLAFLDLLLDAYDNGEISKEGIREEVDTFTFEGQDTTAGGMTWALYLLGRHPDIQKKVVHEVDSFFETRPDTVTVEDVKFRYLECVLKEAQRIFPSVPFFSRLTTENCELGGYFIPKGTTIGVSTLQLHRNSEMWPEPCKFNPDRFLQENIQGRNPYAFIPFSAGPRNCI